jgi:RNA polymerase-interacting CarD/CdnL/TRCF family regulator
MTTIQVSNVLHNELIKRKLFDRETYEEVIWDLIEDTRELNDQTKRDIEKARDEIKAGNVHTLAQVKKELGL